MLHYVRFFACSFLNFFLLLLWNFFLSKSFFGENLHSGPFSCYLFQYCVDDLLKNVLFQTQNLKKSNHSSTHSISISYYCFIKTRSTSCSHASPQINIDKDIYEKTKQKWKIVHCAVKNGRRVWHQNDFGNF